MARAFLRIDKLHDNGQISRSERHTKRSIETPNADPRKQSLNRVLIGGNNVPLKVETATAIKQTNKRPRKDAVRLLEYMLTANKNWFEQGGADLVERWAKKNRDWLKEKYGNKCLRAVLHLDESTPHIHAYIVPIVERVIEGESKQVLSAQKFMGDREKLSKLQDEYGEAMSEVGLERGFRKSRANHIEIKSFYGAIKKDHTEGLSKDDIQRQLAHRVLLIKENADLKATAKALSGDREQLRLVEKAIARLGYTDLIRDEIERLKTAESRERLRANVNAHEWDEESVKAATKLPDKAVDEWLLESAVPADIVAGNVRWVEGKEAFDLICRHRMENPDYDPEETRREYAYLKMGGWYCEGVNSLTNEPAGWGSFKPLMPRSIKGKVIKYEHPFDVPTQPIFLDVPDRIANEIYKRQGVDPNESDRKKGFWNCVIKHNMDVMVTEGAKKGGSATGAYIPTIILSGVWNGARSKDAEGNKVKPYLVPGLEQFATPGRNITILYDRDPLFKSGTKKIKSTRRDIRLASERLARCFTDRGANVFRGQLPKVEGVEKLGIDDFIASQGPEAIARIEVTPVAKRKVEKSLELERD